MLSSETSNNLVFLFPSLPINSKYTDPSLDVYKSYVTWTVSTNLSVSISPIFPAYS